MATTRRLRWSDGCTMKIASSSFMFVIIAVLIVAKEPSVMASLPLLINPERGHLSRHGDNLTVVCHAFEPIDHCQFNFITDDINYAVPLLDLSQGALSPVDPAVINDRILDYKYVGRGLGNGVCGIRLHLKGWKRYMLGCRTRSRTADWRYAIMSFTADESNSIAVKVTPAVAVALPGTDVNVLCKAEGTLTWCRFDLPGPVPTTHIFLDEGAESSQSTSEHRYLGAGLSSGECGVTLTRVTERNNGYAWCGLITNGSGGWERTAIPVVVAHAPSNPVLKVTSQYQFEGSILKASCTVTRARPAPNITWYLGEEMVRQDTINDVPDDTWGWPTSTQTMTQRLTRQLVAADNGRQLKCQVSHVALLQPIVATTTISFANNVCPPLISNSLLISCTLEGIEVDCSNPLLVGAIAKLECKQGYVKPINIIYKITTCITGGRWSKHLFSCIPDCGRRNTNSGGKLVAGGKDAIVGEFPWHIGIYKKDEGNFMYWCGGTLISPNIVISAAHCFWEEQTRKLMPPSEFMAAGGKYHRDWEISNEKVQIRPVKTIRLRPLYSGRVASYASDIAIVNLSAAFELGAVVNIACVDWENQLENRQLTPGQKGVVAGWGFTIHQVQSETLNYVDLPYIDPHECLEALESDLKRLLTHDKFCAGYVNNKTSVCGGDSGGGLMFRNSRNDKYYLRGIVSIAFTPARINLLCYADNFTAFTLVSQFLAWIENYVDT